MKIAIITDGNNELGMGHIYQSLTLAELLLEKMPKKSEIIFLTKSKEKVIDLISQKGFSATSYPNDEKIFETLKNLNPERIIFDKLDVSPSLAEKIKIKIDSKLIICTNLTEANKFADITVLADIGSDFKNIYHQDEVTRKVQFWGPKYWLLRPEFYDYKKKIKKISSSVKNIMMIFGGADPCNYSSNVLNELLKIDKVLNITLVIGSAFVKNKELNDVINSHKSSKSKVEVVQNLKTVAETMYINDVVFASPGLSFFEALAVGTPVIGFHQNDLQRDVYKGFLDTFGINDIDKVSSFITNKTFIYPTDEFIKSMEIGEGKNEIINEIIN